MANMGQFEHKVLYKKNAYNGLYNIEYVFHLFTSKLDIEMRKRLRRKKVHLVTISRKKRKEEGKEEKKNEGRRRSKAIIRKEVFLVYLKEMVIHL